MSKITLYKKPFELDRVKHYLVFLLRFLLLGDIFPPSYPLYDLEMDEHALWITTHVTDAAGGNYSEPPRAIPFHAISFCSLDKKKKEVRFDVSEEASIWFWYRKNEDKVERFYNQLVHRL